VPTRRVLKGVLTSFLGTYTSRYTSYRGFWLFGFLVERLDRLDIDLLTTDADESANQVIARAKTLAVKKFATQLEKSGLHRTKLLSAVVTLERHPDDNSVFGQHYRAGYNIRFIAVVTTDNGRCFERNLTVFVAPHDPGKETASMDRE
jgi:hypothetical protein